MNLRTITRNFPVRILQDSYAKEEWNQLIPDEVSLSHTRLTLEVAEFGADTPMKRPAQPEEIAPAYVYFASEADSSYVTGEVLTLLGGETTAG
jgi:NAD(P)-dependent dehydrogenase (short-subunit alcohol dehydrogenase family)